MTYDVLAGVKVVEVAMYAFAPSAGAVLADWGADVVKVVPPHTADPMNGNPVAALPDKDVGVKFMWEILNRGKRCIGLDVSTEEGGALLRNLVREADVFITNLLPGARRRFGLDVADLRAVNPRLVYARATGHGDRGPERDRGGYDITDFWSRAGVGHAASQVSDEFVPLASPAFGDLASGGFLAGAIAAALFRRERTGEGAVVDVSLLSSAMWVMSPNAVAARLYGVEAIPRFRHADAPNPLVNAYRTADGRFLYLSGVMTQGAFTALCTAIGREDLAADPRFADAERVLANARACITELDAVFAARPLAFWAEALADLPIPWTVVRSAGEAGSDPQVLANDYLVSVEGPSGAYPLVPSPAQFDGIRPHLTRAPAHGEHGDAIAEELGLDWEEVVRLKVGGDLL
ncbi:MAG: CoA transferase [Streptomycetaceae bacterium]|nr:CoA transferase [Streptomycetaceae bacterium]